MIELRKKQVYKVVSWKERQEGCNQPAVYLGPKINATEEHLFAYRSRSGQAQMFFLIDKDIIRVDQDSQIIVRQIGGYSVPPDKRGKEYLERMLDCAANKTNIDGRG